MPCIHYIGLLSPIQRSRISFTVFGVVSRYDVNCANTTNPKNICLSIIEIFHQDISLSSIFWKPLDLRDSNHLQSESNNPICLEIDVKLAAVYTNCVNSLALHEDFKPASYILTKTIFFRKQKNVLYICSWDSQQSRTTIVDKDHNSKNSYIPY